MARSEFSTALRVALTVGAFLTGCASTAYQPKRFPHLKLVMVDGAPRWMSGDELLRATGFGGNLVRVVEDVPEALAYAEEARDDTLWALVLAVAGPVVMVSGVALGLVAGGEDFLDSPAGQAVVFSALGVGTVMSGFGVHLVQRAQARQLDAINAYNDAMIEDLLRRRGVTGPLEDPPPGADDRDDRGDGPEDESAPEPGGAGAPAPE